MYLAPICKSPFFFFFTMNTSVAAASTQCYDSSLECFFKKGKEILQNSETEFCLCSYADSSVIDPQAWISLWNSARPPEMGPDANVMGCPTLQHLSNIFLEQSWTFPFSPVISVYRSLFFWRISTSLLSQSKNVHSTKNYSSLCPLIPTCPQEPCCRLYEVPRFAPESHRHTLYSF